MPRPSFLNLQKFEVSLHCLQVGIQNSDVRKVGVVIHQHMLAITGKDANTNGNTIILKGNSNAGEVLIKPNEFERYWIFCAAGARVEL